MSEAIGDMNAYIQLTDEVFHRISQYTGDEMPEIEKVYNFFFLSSHSAFKLNWHT